MSIAGKREGFEGERSVLFLDQIRIIKEMRERDKQNGISAVELRRPRYMLWENVPGAFSSRKGEDFKAVLEETIKVAEPEIPPLSVPEKGWPNAGLIYDEMGGWSVAWRVHDARYWGVPQRRRRVALVADFAGLSAGEILFERKGLCRYSEESEREKSFVARRDSKGSETENSSGRYYQNRRREPFIKGPCDTTETVQAAYGEGGNITPIVVKNTNVYDNHPQDSRLTGPIETAPTMTSYDYGVSGGGGPLVVHSYGLQGNTIDRKPQNGGNGAGYSEEEETSTLVATDWKDAQAIVEPKTLKERAGKPGGGKGALIQNNLSATLGTSQDQTLFTEDADMHYIARRITPIECERLQGYPEREVWQMDFDKMTKDEYIAWNLEVGNIIADTENGRVYVTRGPGGVRLKNPREIKGTNLCGYKVMTLKNGETRYQCKIHRIIWIAAHGVIPAGYVVDHINNNKSDNRIENLQLLTPEENSHKAKQDGCYRAGNENPSTKISPDLWTDIAKEYITSDKTIRDLAKEYGISKSRIHQILHKFALGWTDIGEWVDSKGKIRQSTDAMRYKALGNSIALPYWKVLARRIAAQYDRDITMGSLFDGIGGFIIAFQHAGATCRFTAEIEDYPRAVVKYHFGGEDVEETTDEE